MKRILLLTLLLGSTQISAKSFLDQTKDFIKEHYYSIPCAGGAIAATILSKGEGLAIGAATCAGFAAHYYAQEHYSTNSPGSRSKRNIVYMNRIKKSVIPVG